LCQAVVVYSKTWCPYCTQCKELLDSMGLPYAVVEPDRRDDGEAVQAGAARLNPTPSPSPSPTLSPSPSPSSNPNLLQAALLALTQQRTVPNVFVAGQHLGGNDDTQAAAGPGEGQGEGEGEGQG